MDAVRISRRSLLQGGLALTAGVGTAGLVGCTNSRGATSAKPTLQSGEFTKAKINWRQFSGSTLQIAVQPHPWYAAVQKLLPQFTELTGIKVVPALLGVDQYISKIAIELASGASTPDVYMVNQFGQAATAGWLEPLDAFLSDSKLTDPDWYQLDDIFSSAKVFGQSNGKQLALPISSEAEMLFVRSDLVSKVPQTLGELVDAAARAHSKDVAGFTSRAIANGAETPWAFAGFAFTSGGLYLDRSGKPVLNSPPNVSALTLYAELIRKYGPRGAAGWGYLENSQSMQQGRAAMWTDSSALLGGLKDQTQSKYAAKIDAYAFPSQGGKSVPNVFYWLVGINSKSTNKDAAWLFTQWATSAAVSLAAGEAGASPARASVWRQPSTVKPIGAANAARTLEVLKTTDAVPMRLAWQDSKWARIADILGRAVNTAVTGGSVSSVLSAAQASALGVK